MAETGYAPAGELEMYYEVHGSGRPLVLLHGAYMSADTMGPLLGPLAAERRVVVPEMQGHGRTADADRPITYEQMADDTAALIGHLGLEDADVVGYSMGAATGSSSASATRARAPARGDLGLLHQRRDAARGAGDVPVDHPEMFAGSPMEQEYQRLAPDPAASGRSSGSSRRSTRRPSRGPTRTSAGSPRRC